MTAPARCVIKICGVTSEADVHACARAGADLVGIVRFERSPRFVDEALATELIGCARANGVEPVALFVDAPLSAIASCPATIVQLHGSEDESMVASVAALGRHVVRGFRDTADARARWDACEHVHTLLVDGGTGGTGEAIDLDAIAAARASLSHPVFLAGGLDAGNVAGAIARVRPDGVDVSSGVERTRGVKDHDRIHAFCDAVRSLEL